MTGAHRHDPDPTVGAAALHPVADGAFAWVQPDGTWWVNNAGAVTPGADAAPDRVLVVDTCATAARTRRFLAAVAAATGDAPVRLAVNTHEHGDHTYGNCLLPPAATIIGHERMRERLLADPVIDGCPPAWDPVPDWGGVTRRVPDLVTAGSLTVHLGDRRVDVLHPGHAAHTTGDLAVWLPAEEVLFSGDLIFHGLTPLVVSGSVDGARRALDWVAGLNPAVVVPGHGPLVPRAELGRVLAEHERYYRLVADVATAGRRRGLSPLQAAQQADLGEFAGWADGERLVLNLHRAYAEADGGDVDLLAAFVDAVTWNGGAPLTTHVCCA